QAARMMEWLDEERRSDKATIATLEERMVLQQETIATLSKRLNSMVSDQNVIRTQITPSRRETDLIEQVRKEVLQLIENVEAKRLTSEREADRRADLARENLARPIRELTEKLEKLERRASEIPAFQVERERIADSVATLQQRVD